MKRSCWPAASLLLISLAGCPVFLPAGEWAGTDLACLDHWSVGHFDSGVALGGILGRDSFGLSLAALVGWEVFEPSVWPGESAQNQYCDIVVGGLGWVVGTAVADH